MRMSKPALLRTKPARTASRISVQSSRNASTAAFTTSSAFRSRAFIWRCKSFLITNKDLATMWIVAVEGGEMSTIGDKIKQARVDKNLSLEEISNRLRINIAYLQNIEQSKF